ncbi:YtxH domain-containing protein [Clostridium sp. JN-9]|uniref:YtxH domain-containing protein n=1 Tax=Clostridium sp. JN-9 TaxID=2507159 RepID=UPI000FFDFA4D|nr:YtxH domain-containing protein [Clostridium sp. JN-9]QAT41158.1 YtxH domain-containing protein [Clostridium sp. JN-9]
MQSRFFRGMTTGAMLGFAASMLVVPQLDRGTKKKLKRTARIVRSTAGDAYCNMKDWMR